MTEPTGRKRRLRAYAATIQTDAQIQEALGDSPRARQAGAHVAAYTKKQAAAAIGVPESYVGTNHELTELLENEPGQVFVRSHERRRESYDPDLWIRVGIARPGTRMLQVSVITGLDDAEATLAKKQAAKDADEARIAGWAQQREDLAARAAETTRQVTEVIDQCQTTMVDELGFHAATVDIGVSVNAQNRYGVLVPAEVYQALVARAADAARYENL